jgi:pimeloyl-ACP methyl ester carboxylesterase
MGTMLIGLSVVALAAAAAAQDNSPAPVATYTVEDVAAKAPPPPDYRQQTSWSVFASQGFTSSLPAGATPAAETPRVAVFFIHPTTFRGAAGVFSQDPADAEASKWTDASSIARQASAFTGCCSVYAPRYRAASSVGFASAPPIREAAFALAYTDIERAFDAFLETIGDRPFIIAGHSQGAFHAATLLEKRIDGTPLQKRMVAAYTIGINLAEGEFGKRFKSVKPCTTPAATGCVVQWNAILDGMSDPAKLATVFQSPYVQKYGDDAGKLTLCINPLTFDAASRDAGVGSAKGAVPGAPGFGDPNPLKAEAVSAHCEQGLLLVKPDKALALEPLPNGGMHFHDIGLFWADIRANAALRAARFAEDRQ